MSFQKRLVSGITMAVAAVMLLAGCGTGNAAVDTPVAAAISTATSVASGGAMDKVRVQLKWLNQAQFAGFYVAADKGYYKAENLDVELMPGGPDIVPSQKVLTGGADVALDWVGSLLANRDKGQPLVDISQLYQSSGLLLITKKTSGITSPKDLKGKKVGVWTGGNEFEFRALMDKYGYDNSIDNNKDMTVIKQGFDMDPFINDQLDAASAMVYNEYPIVLESGIKASDMNIISYNDEGVGMLEDHIFTTEQLVKDKHDVLVRFLAATRKGWIDAVKDQAGAVNSVMSRVDTATTTKEHQTTMMAEVAKLVMPAGLTEAQVGVIDEAKFASTASIALKFNVISKPAANAYTNDLIKAAIALP